MIMDDYLVILCMIKFGGSFVSKLGEAAAHADSDNLERLKKAFPEYWTKYKDLAKANHLNE